MSDFWLGFVVCFAFVCVIGMVLVYVTALAEGLHTIHKNRRPSDNTKTGEGSE